MTIELIRGMSADEYHQTLAYCSHSRLREFEKRGERYYYQRFISGEIVRKTTKALDYGTAFETLFQRPDVFHAQVAVAPEGMDGRTNQGKAWNKAQAGAGKLAIDHDEYQAMLQMAESIRENATLVELMNACEMQVCIRGTVWGVPFQTLPDWLSLTGCPATDFRPFTLDLKSTKDLNDLRYPEGVTGLGYHSQASLGRKLLRAYLAQEGDAEADTLHFLAAVEKQPAYRSAALALDPEVLDYGDRYYEKYAPQLAHCLAHDRWPRALTEPIRIGLPARARFHQTPDHEPLPDYP